MFLSCKYITEQVLEYHSVNLMSNRLGNLHQVDIPNYYYKSIFSELVNILLRGPAEAHLQVQYFLNVLKIH